MSGNSVLVSWTEAAESLAGAWGIARRDPQALDYFHISIGSFWRSFSAILFALPFFVFILNTEWQILGDLNLRSSISPYSYASIQTVSYLLSWAVFPIVMIVFARFLSLSDAYIPFIIVYNWSNVLALAVMAIPFLLYAVGLGSAAVVNLLVLVSLCFVLWYRYEVARRALGVEPGLAISVVTLDFMLGLLLGGLSQQVIAMAGTTS